MRCDFSSAAALQVNAPACISLPQRAQPSTSLEALTAKCFTGVTHLVTGLQTRWLGCEPSDAIRVYFANHTSHVDFLLLWTSLPDSLRRQTRPVAARDYWQNGSVKSHLAERVFRSVFVERECPTRMVNGIMPMLRAIDRGESLILFPEGTRGDGETLLPFRAGIFHLACERPDVEFVPVWLTNSNRVLPKGALLPLPLLCTVTFGRPTRIEEREEKECFLQRLRHSLLNLRTL